MNRVITISEQFGSGGRPIGKMVSERLGLPYYDHALIEVIAKDCGYVKDFIKERGKSVSSISWPCTTSPEWDINQYSVQDEFWMIHNRVIKEVADKGPCVIVDCCADYVLKERADLLTVFVYASLEKRTERILSIYGEPGKNLERRLKDKDNRRRSYYQLYTDMEWGDAKNYHVALNSGVLGFGSCASIITSLC